MSENDNEEAATQPKIIKLNIINFKYIITIIWTLSQITKWKTLIISLLRSKR